MKHTKRNSRNINGAKMKTVSRIDIYFMIAVVVNGIIAFALSDSYFTPNFGNSYRDPYWFIQCGSIAYLLFMFRNPTARDMISFPRFWGNWLVSICIGAGIALLFQPPITQKEALELALAHPSLVHINELTPIRQRFTSDLPAARKGLLYPEPYTFYSANEHRYTAFVSVDPQTGHVAYVLLADYIASTRPKEIQYDRPENDYSTHPPFD